jgi:Dehydrogenases with different specificities (related to short-chain alcohol dehydrogenases)
VGALNGQGALVTGGSRGIGRAIVKRLAADGAAVVFSYLQNEAAAREVVSEVTEDGGRAVAVQADQGSLDDLRRLTGQAGEHLDALDIVVINAAGCPVVLIDDMTEDAYDRYMAVHAKGPFFLIQHAGRALRDGGRIIAISTLNTRLHPPGGALYTGAKGALENFTKVAAIELGRRGITANVVSPGATDTEMLRAANPVRRSRTRWPGPRCGGSASQGISRPWWRSWPAPTPAGSAARTWRRRGPAALTTLSWVP